MQYATMTFEQAKELHDSGFWTQLTAREIAEFQIFTERLCIPFDVFHKALEETLGRSVGIHELALSLDGLKAELRGARTTLDEAKGL